MRERRAFLDQLPIKILCGPEQWFFTSAGITIFFSMLVMLRHVQSKLHWKGIVHLNLFPVTGTVRAFQHNNNGYFHVQPIVLIT